MRYVGIDPGVNGAIAWMDEDNNGCGSIKMPKEGYLRQGMRGHVCEHFCDVYVEDIPKGFSGMVNQSTMAVLHRNFGYMLGVLACTNITPIMVRPQTWQKDIPGLKGLKGKDRKNALWEHAKECFPDIKVFKYSADALLIAKWGSEQ